MLNGFTKPKIKYDFESDVLSWELSVKPIDDAIEIGNMIVHFSKDHAPVLVELLEARKFFSKTRHLIEKEAALAV